MRSWSSRPLRLRKNTFFIFSDFVCYFLLSDFLSKEFIVYSTLSTLVKEQKIASKVATDAMKKYNIDPKKPIPTKL